LCGFNLHDNRGQYLVTFVVITANKTYFVGEKKKLNLLNRTERDTFRTTGLKNQGKHGD